VFWQHGGVPLQSRRFSKLKRKQKMKNAGLTIISLCIAFLFIGCAGKGEPQVPIPPPPTWNKGKANDMLYYYGVGGPVKTMDEARLKAREDCAQSIEVTVESEMKRFIYEKDEEYHEEVVAKSRSYTRQHLPEPEIVDTYIAKTEFSHNECYALARLKRQVVVDLMEAPIREIQRDVINHLRRGSEHQAQGQLIDALTEFGQGWQKALTLPRKFNWLSDEKTERYSEHLEKLLDGLVRGFGVRKLSFRNETEEESIIVTAEFRVEHAAGSERAGSPFYLKQLALTATYIEGGGKLRSSNGQEGTSVNIITDDKGQAEVFIQERGKSIHKNRIRITLDKASINPLYSLIGQDRVSALLAKEVIVPLSEPQKYRVAVLPFENLRQGTEMDWIAQYLQDALTNKLTQAKSIEVLARLDLPAILKELDLQMSDLADPRAAMRIGHTQGATHIVTGTYTPIGTRLRISARLMDVEKGSVELSAEEEGDVIEAQSQLGTAFFDLAGNLAFSLAIQLDPGLAKSAEFLHSEVKTDAKTEFSHSIVDPAIEIFKRALRLQNQGQIDEAIDLYKSRLELDKNRAEAYNNLGICYGKKKLFKEAQEAYETAIRLKPRFPEVYNNLGWLLLETGDAERVIEQFQKGLEFAPKTLAEEGSFEAEQREHIWINLAWAYYIKGDYEKAIETNEAILQEYPLALYPRYNLALAYLRNGNIDAAEREYKTAYNQTSRPDKPAYQSALDDLQSLLTKGISPREAQRMLEILRWRK
jgi:tetratricopeptide (TPR) repeat protein